MLKEPEKQKKNEIRIESKILPEKTSALKFIYFFVTESRKCNWIEKTTHKMHLLLLHLAIGYLSYFIWLLLAGRESRNARKKKNAVCSVKQSIK